jgi:hypothetical protein
MQETRCFLRSIIALAWGVDAAAAMPPAPTYCAVSGSPRADRKNSTIDFRVIRNVRERTAQPMQIPVRAG